MSVLSTGNKTPSHQTITHIRSDTGFMNGGLQIKKSGNYHEENAVIVIDNALLSFLQKKQERFQFKVGLMSK